MFHEPIEPPTPEEDYANGLRLCTTCDHDGWVFDPETAQTSRCPDACIEGIVVVEGGE